MAPTTRKPKDEKPPTGEIGTVTDGPLIPVAGTHWFALQNDDEYSPELQWPLSLEVYDRVANDPRVAGVLAAFVIGIMKRRVVLLPNGAAPDVLEQISEDLGVPVLGEDEDQPVPPMSDRFDEHEHRELTLRNMLVYGHYPTELVGEVEDTTRAWWRLRDLGARPPKTIGQWLMDPKGSGRFEGVQQHNNITSKPIPAHFMAVWVWGKRPGSMLGTSMLRKVYQAYLLKQGASRITMTNIEKAGGVPWATAPINAGKKLIQEINAVLSRFRVGKRSSATFPAGTKVDFAKGAGVGEGIDFINLQNEEITFAVQMMFAGLGSGNSTGNRSLGEVHVNAWLDQQEAVASAYLKGMNRDVIERVVRWNKGKGEQAPLLAFVDDDHEEMSIEVLAQAKAAGLVEIDDGVLDLVRKRLRLGARQPGSSRAKSMPGGSAPEEPAPVTASTSLRASVLAADGPRLPDRELGREPTAMEIAAGVDFAALEHQREASITALLSAWTAIRAEQIADLVAQIAHADGDLVRLLDLRPQPLGHDLLVAAQMQLLEEGAAGAIAEALHQGVTLPDPDLEVLRQMVEARALSTAEMIAQDLGSSASSLALFLTEPGLQPLNPLEVGELVGKDLDAKSLAYVENQLAGMVHASQLAGRFAAWSDLPAGSQIVATELLDAATCDPCRAIDETVFPTLAAAARAYPTGGYWMCKGRRLCRGSVFVRFGDETPAVRRGNEFDVKASFDEGKHPRGQRGQWIRKGLPELPIETFDNAARMTREHGGGTFSAPDMTPFRGADGTFQVALPREQVERVVANDAQLAGEIDQYRRDYADLLGRPNHYLGTYVADDGRVAIDVSELVQDRDLAVRVGRSRRQESIMDWGAFNRGDWDNAFIDTGGKVGE